MDLINSSATVEAVAQNRDNPYRQYLEFEVLQDTLWVADNNTASIVLKNQIENMARVVVYVKLYDRLQRKFVDSGDQKLGLVHVQTYRDGAVQLRKEYPFPNHYNQIVRQGVESIGIDRIEIGFSVDQPSNYCFVLSKLRVRGLSDEGYQFFKEKEENHKLIQSLKAKKGNIVKNYKNILKDVSGKWSHMQQLVGLEKMSTLMQTHQKAFNFFEDNSQFKKAYLDFLDGLIDENSKNRIETAFHQLQNEIVPVESGTQGNTFWSYASVLDHFFTGGKISRLVSMIENVFGNGMQVGQIPVLCIDQNCYQPKKLNKYLEGTNAVC